MQVNSLKEIVIVSKKEIVASEGDEECEKSVAEEREARRLNRSPRNRFVRVHQFARHVRPRHHAWR